MRTIIVLSFLLFGHLGTSQLIDPFGKIKTHEIKLTKLKDGTYKGAMEWTTGGIDSLQRFVVQNLDVKAPVMVRIISKAPDHNIELSFHKKSWEAIESKVSTEGDKFADKIFRTMGMAGIGVSSKVAGIPYLIIVKVGLQFPATKSLIRITDDLEEYNSHLRKMGIATNVNDKNLASSNNMGIASTTPSDKNNTLMYVIIGLLSLIIVLLGLFLLRKQKSKTTLVLWFAMCLSAYTMAQSNVPKPVPVDGQGESPVFFNYRTSNVANQTPIAIENPRVRNASARASDVFEVYRPVRIESNPESRELSAEEVTELQRRMNESDDDFDRNYRENNPGEPTDGDQRTLPVDRTQEQIAQLRREIRQLRRQVEMLSQEDEVYEEQGNDGEEMLLYCEEIEECQECISKGHRKFMKHHAYFQYLQNFYQTKMNQLSGWISYGDALASTPGAGLGWASIRQHKVMPSMLQLESAYNEKFDEYITIMEQDLNEIETCYGYDDIDADAIPNQVFAMIQRLKNNKITVHHL